MRRCGVWQTLFYILCLEKNAGEIPRFKFLGVLGFFLKVIILHISIIAMITHFSAFAIIRAKICVYIFKTPHDSITNAAIKHIQ